MLSRILVFLINEKSVLTKSGPITELRPRLPGEQMLWVAASHGDESTCGLAIQLLGLPVTISGAEMLGRKVRVLFGKKRMVSGLPLCAWVMIPSCQPETRRFPLKGN